MMFVVLFVVFDCAVKLLPLIMKSFASGNMDMVVRQIDDGNRRLLNSCQCVNTGHNLSCHSEFFPCSILPLQMILPLYLALRQVHYLKNGNAAGHERIVSSPKVFNDCGMRVLCESRSVVRYWFATQDATWKCCVGKGVPATRDKQVSYGHSLCRRWAGESMWKRVN